MKADRLYFLLGATGLVLAFLFLVLGLYGVFVGTANAGLAGTLCFAAFFIPALFFFYYWRSSTSVDTKLRTLADILKGYRQVSMAEIASKIGAQPEDAELLVAACIGRGLVQGKIDKRDGTFVLASTNAKSEDSSSS